MDLQDLNKSQLILLAVLLSFVTSIATGITTVTLMQQAPASFTVPVNRIIRQTVEKIQQVEGKTTVETVIIKEEDLIVDAISKNQSAVFALSKEGFDLSGAIIEIPLGRAFAVSEDNIVVADGSLASFKDIYFLKNSSGKFKADFISTDKAGFAFLKIGFPFDENSKLAYTVPTFGDLGKMKIGQKILVLGSTISSSIFEGDGNININVTKANAGGLVFNLDGEVLGIALLNEATPFAGSSVINEALKSIEISEVP
jgi:hypothetical protein